MGTTTTDDKVAGALFGQVRRGILALLFSHSDGSYYVRQIASIAGGGLGAVHRELNNLVRAGLVVRTSRGNQVLYQANRDSPVFADLRGLIVKTVGIVDVLRGALAPLAPRIRIALIYGSIARGSETALSDIDLMIIGDTEFGDIVSALRPAQEQLAREINPSVFTPEEVHRRLADNDHFMATVMREDKVFLIGHEHDLRGLG